MPVMTNPAEVPLPPDVLPPEPGGALSVPPPVPQKKPGFLRRLFMSRKRQQAVAMQNGYLEMVDLIRAIRAHLDRQETVQTHVLAMLEKVPGAMDRQHEVMSMFKQQLESGMENNRRLTESMGNLNNTLSAMDESQRASSRTITDLIHRSRESEQLLREVMRRSERRMTALLVIFFLAVAALGFYFVRWQNRGGKAAAKPAIVQVAPAAKPAPAETKAEKPAPPPSAVKKDAETKPPPPAVKAAQDEAPAPAPAPPEKKEKGKTRTKAKSKAAEPSAGAPAPAGNAASAEASASVGQADLTLDQIQQAVGQTLPDAQAPVPPADKPVSIP
jgi:hypothetical protein